MSRTYGCADRAYWYYRTLTNFPGATWQQLMLGLAALHRLGADGSDTGLEVSPAEAAAAALGWWARHAHRDGSFDEWYRNEHSYCPTAITAAGAALTLDLLGDALPGSVRDTAVGALERAGGWLEGRYNPTVMNQNLAAATAMQGLFRLTGAPRWQRAGEDKLAAIARDQHEEGWLPEYGGADFGYSTLALDFLAACHGLGAAQAGPIAEQLIGFLSLLGVDHAGYPGRLGSRGTGHLFTFGALYFADANPAAAALAGRWLSQLANGRGPNLRGIDDRYFAYFYFPQFALAALQATHNPAGLSERQRGGPASVELPGAGFVLRRQEGRALMISRRLGGALALQPARGVPLYHLGYEVVAGDRRYSSAIWTDGPLQGSDDLSEVSVSAPFYAAASGLPLERLMVPFQLLTELLANGRLAELFQSVVKKRMVTPRRSLALRLERKVHLGETIRICDRLVPGDGLRSLERLAIAGAISMHSPSARQDGALVIRFPSAALEHLRQTLANGSPVCVNWRLPMSGPDAEIDDIE
ncbi:hypothetical protein [Afifella pfennigii]|uniref:hypothetical protein n=1 Tax=Afifella pfennigii TaxID=209897 RepID=UPI0012EC6976|nr:hypothetical protein [Afifella pfennigii]